MPLHIQSGVYKSTKSAWLDHYELANRREQPLPWAVVGAWTTELWWLQGRHWVTPLTASDGKVSCVHYQT